MPTPDEETRERLRREGLLPKEPAPAPKPRGPTSEQWAIGLGALVLLLLVIGWLFFASEPPGYAAGLMHPHYVVVEDFIDKFGTPHVRGDVIVVGDTTPIEALLEIETQLALGTIREVQAGEGVARPDREA